MELKWTSKALSDLVPLNAAAISEGIPLAYNKYHTVEKRFLIQKKIIFQDKVLNNDCFFGVLKKKL